MQDLLLSELAEITRRHPATLRRLARAGRLPGVYKIGARWMISRLATDRLRHIENLGEGSRP